MYIFKLDVNIKSAYTDWFLLVICDFKLLVSDLNTFTVLSQFMIQETAFSDRELLTVLILAKILFFYPSVLTFVLDA